MVQRRTDTAALTRVPQQGLTVAASGQQHFVELASVEGQSQR